MALLLAATLPTLAACHRQFDQAAAPDFNVEVITSGVVPNLVRLKFTNNSDDFLCISRSEAEDIGHTVKLSPPSSSDLADNRPPPQMLGQMDVRQGLIVVPPHAAGDDYVDLTIHLQGRVPRATGIEGIIHAVSCRALFTAKRPPAAQRSFKQNLATGD